MTIKASYLILSYLILKELFQNEILSKAQSKSTEQWFKNNKVNVLSWPSQSREAVHACHEEWAKITPERIQTLLKEVPKELGGG
uniref:Uncharacterized protein n=1 Tax=Monopterus albus TaxID=43700 RepID=A0A3Q3QMG8_MONAL